MLGRNRERTRQRDFSLFDGVSPSLAVDFLGASLDPRIVLTRSSSATRINSSGLLEVVAINAPRFDYDPSTLAPRGLLIEELRSNLCTYSNAFNTGWGVFGTAATVANQAISPDGTNNAWSYTGSNGGNLKYKSFSATGTYTVSIWARGDVGGETLFLQSAPSGASQNFVLTTSWRRYSFTYTGTWSRFDFGLGGTTQKAYIYEAQIELGAFVTSNIPTVASAVQRDPDIALMTGADFSSWFSANEGTLLAQYSSPASGARAIWSFDDGTANESITLRTSGTDPKFAVVDGGVLQVDIDAGLASAGLVSKFAGGYGLNNFGASINGGDAVTDASGTLPLVNQARIGASQAGEYLCGHVRNLKFYPAKFTSAELKASTT